jgi:Flp pilus assembly pilin Flp
MSEGNGLVRRWLREEHGQDLIEYALLCGAVGFAGTVAFSFISTAMNTTYTSWDNAVQDDLLVEPCDPAPATCPTGP